MNPRLASGRIAGLTLLVVILAAGIGLTIYWTMIASFPEITPGGWLVVCAYLFLVVAVPTAATPVLSRTIDLERRTWGRAWRVTASVWVTITAIVGLLAWPMIGPYIQPFFKPH